MCDICFKAGLHFPSHTDGHNITLILFFSSKTRLLRLLAPPPPPLPPLLLLLALYKQVREAGLGRALLVPLLPPPLPQLQACLLRELGPALEACKSEVGVASSRCCVQRYLTIVLPTYF